MCLLPDDLSEISDIRRQRLFTLEVNTYALITSGRYDEAKLLISERLSLLREEKINTPATRLPCLVDAIIAELKYLSIYEVLAALIQPKIDNSDDRIKYEIDSAVLSALSSSSTPSSTVNNTNTSDSIHTSSHSFLELVKEAALTARTCKGVESIEYEGLSQLEDRVLELSINITI